MLEQLQAIDQRRVGTAPTEMQLLRRDLGTVFLDFADTLAEYANFCDSISVALKIGMNPDQLRHIVPPLITTGTHRIRR